MVTKKIAGWVLVLAGVLMIAWGVWSSSQIFTLKKSAPEMFKVEESDSTSNEAQDQIQQQMQDVIQNQLGKMLPTDSMPGMLNLIAWSVFMTILIFGGGKIAFIGIKLLK
ncbi:MAG: hypothetical protein HQ539_02570 [Parcubacteria group bacterium]|nr:hypothetical protein [Parcubacteria group bacterium]